ncbi:MAG: histidine kinase dimerization/phospho-acceptor domain-containing protein [Meiothermus sp.]|nr:histidine kinase dimerization/phospho-acceptor domain-containing protein [Meiothermus sp.]
MITLLQTAWESAREGVLVFADGKVVYLNPVAAEVLEVEREKVQGRPLLLALRDHQLDALCRLGGEAKVGIRGRTVRARVVPGVLLLWDVTEEQQRVEALEESSRVLAHEFRTPVAGMLTLLEALQDGLAPEESREVLAMLQQEAERLRRLVEDLPLSRMPSKERTFALEELQARLERFLAPLMAERSSWIEWNLPHTVRANPDAVYQALLNLLDNALKYGPGGRVEVSSGASEDGVWLEVRDRGRAIQEFEPLFQAGKRGVTAANVRGTGLGLALVRRLAGGWGGEAYGRSLEDGSAFGLTFPSKPGARVRPASAPLEVSKK